MGKNKQIMYIIALTNILYKRTPDLGYLIKNFKKCVSIINKKKTDHFYQTIIYNSVFYMLDKMCVIFGLNKKDPDGFKNNNLLHCVFLKKSNTYDEVYFKVPK